jgi:hypothetical protein
MTRAEATGRVGRCTYPIDLDTYCWNMAVAGSGRCESHSIRPPLAKGDDGSANRYPSRKPNPVAAAIASARHNGLLPESEPAIIGWHGLIGTSIVATYGNRHYAERALALGTVDSIVPVPATLFAETPERCEPACLADDEPLDPCTGDRPYGVLVHDGNLCPVHERHA